MLLNEDMIKMFRRMYMEHQKIYYQKEVKILKKLTNKIFSNKCNEKAISIMICFYYFMIDSIINFYKKSTSKDYCFENLYDLFEKEKNFKELFEKIY